MMAATPPVADPEPMGIPMSLRLMRPLACLPLALLAAALQAEEPPRTDGDANGPLAGHSYHGEVFNEGPRQSAYLMEGTGAVAFPVTTDSEDARRFVTQGIGQLHGFWYFEAERSFRQAAALDPDCAIAYWGMAMANGGNADRARKFIAEAVKRKEHAGPHEALYIDALDAFHKADDKKDKERREAYVRALEEIVHQYPDDLEAKAFLALQLWQNKGKGIPLGSPMAVEALLRDVLDKNPMHPCHHYLIHLWDGDKAERALASAALCGRSAPGIAHMWHMPGHIYSRLKRYRDAAWQQEASARVDHAHMIRDRVLPDQIHNFAHNNEWLIRNLIHVGRMHDAIDLARNMIELPRHPDYNTVGDEGSSSHFGRLRLFETLSQFEQWDQLIALSGTMYLEPTDDELEQVRRLRYLGRAQFAKGNADAGRAQLADLEARLADLKAREDAAVAEAVAKFRAETLKKLNSQLPPGDEDDSVEAPHPEQLTARIEKEFSKDLERARRNGSRPFASRKQALEAAVKELQGWAAVAAGDVAGGLELLKKAGGIDPTLLAPVQTRAGKHEDAEKALAGHVDSNKNEVLPLAHLVNLRWMLGKRDEAKAAFEQLRAISHDIDLDAPAMVRLAPIVKELGYPEDWRATGPFAADTGERPELDALGPFRWHPSPAPAWTLRDVRGEEHTLAAYRGRPVVVIFYLGYGCVHCAEQLQAFAPKAQEFEKAGIALVAISTDDPEALQRSLDNDKDGDFPFPLLSDAALDVFKSYRCHDDFESQPLHGTFLVDGDGMVRWQDISYEPFMDADFLLKEARRLLSAAPVLTAKASQPSAE